MQFREPVLENFTGGLAILSDLVFECFVGFESLLRADSFDEIHGEPGVFEVLDVGFEDVGLNEEGVVGEEGFCAADAEGGRTEAVRAADGFGGWAGDDEAGIDAFGGDDLVERNYIGGGKTEPAADAAAGLRLADEAVWAAEGLGGIVDGAFGCEAADQGA